MIRSRVINTVGLAFTAVVLVIVLITKFLAGAWIAILAMVIFFMIMRGIRAPLRQRARWSSRPTRRTRSCPTRVHAIVLVSKLHKPTLRALAFAKATRPNVLEARLRRHRRRVAPTGCWRSGTSATSACRSRCCYSPYRELVRPIVDYATEIRQANPRGVVAVYIPEYVVGRWWEQLLHNQTALRLKGRLLFTPGRDGDLGALPAALLADRPRARGARARPGSAPATCAAASVDDRGRRDRTGRTR